MNFCSLLDKWVEVVIRSKIKRRIDSIVILWLSISRAFVKKNDV